MGMAGEEVSVRVRIGQTLERLLLLGAAVYLAGCSQPEAPSEPGTGGSTAPAVHNVQAPPGALHLVFAYGSEKKEWLKDVTDAFNQARHKTAGGKPIFVNAVPMGSGECVEDVLSGKLKAHLISPASAAFIKLANAESRTKTGKDLVGKTENVVLSPVVIAMWKPMAEALGWGQKPIGWAEILELVRKPEGWGAYGKAQWGQFKFGHTHPDYSNSGLISIFAEVYAATGKQAGLTVQDVRDPRVAQFVGDIEKSVVHYGESTGFFGKKMFANDPQYLNAAVLYENMVIESYNHKLPFPIVAVYPKEGTFWSDHPTGVVEREWVTAEHREAAKTYLEHLLATPQQAKALQYGFRPASLEVKLASPIDAAHGVDPREPQTVLEPPEADVMAAIREVWRANKKHASIVLVADVSGSMKADNKIGHAREGALQLVRMLSDEDRFSLLAFNNRTMWACKDLPLKTGRGQAESAVSSLMADGGTNLYGAVAEAYQQLVNDPKPGRITALVVLSDGADTSQQMSLDQLLKQIAFDGETRTVRVFCIAYGKDAQLDVLEKISEATKAKAYKGGTDDIGRIFKEISTFF